MKHRKGYPRERVVLSSDPNQEMNGSPKGLKNASSLRMVNTDQEERDHGSWTRNIEVRETQSQRPRPGPFPQSFGRMCSSVEITWWRLSSVLGILKESCYKLIYYKLLNAAASRWTDYKRHFFLVWLVQDRLDYSFYSYHSPTPTKLGASLQCTICTTVLGLKICISET